jgi:hypothetical protein
VTDPVVVSITTVPLRVAPLSNMPLAVKVEMVSAKAEVEGRAASMDLARAFLERAGDAVDKLDGPTKVIAVRNALIRAHKDLIDHRANCPHCNEADAP